VILQTLYFNFHEIAGVRIITEDNHAADFFASEYRHHRCESLPASLPHVSLNFHKSSVWAKPGYTRHVHKVVARWDYTLSISPQIIEIDVYGNSLAIPMIHHMLIHPGLRYLASCHGHLLLHAAAVTRDGRSLILTGKGGVGKTTTASLVLSAGGSAWGIQGDDYVFLGEDGRSRMYLTRAHLYRDLVKWIPAVGKRLTPGERQRLAIFGAIRQRSGERIKWPVRIDLDVLWEGRDLIPEAVPAAIILLDKEDIRTPKLSVVPITEEFAERLLEINDFEARHFRALLHKSKAVENMESFIDGWRDGEKKILNRFLAHTPAYLLTLPRSRTASNSVGQDLITALSKLIIPTVEKA